MSKQILYEMPDISYHNGIVNIKAIRDAGCPCIGLRAGYGKNNVDKMFVNNATACYNLGVEALLYWFSYALNEGMSENEAVYAVDQAKKYWKKCGIAFDFEYDSVNYMRKNGIQPDKKLVTDMAIAFLKKVRELGYIPVIYTNEDYLKNYFDMNAIFVAVGAVYVWYARYGLQSLPANRVNITDIWQYTSDGKIAGVTGRVDMNRVYTDFMKSEKLENAKPAVTPNINILNFQKAANADGYRDRDGYKLEEDGLDGPKTQYVRRQIILKANMMLFVGSTGELVKWVQTRCNEILGTNLVVDGKYGKDTRAAVMKLQKLLNLKVDGVAGYNTLQSLFYN